MTKWIGILSMFAGACTATTGDEIAGSRQWLCTQDGDGISCEAAIPAAPGEAGAYACLLGEAAAGCPTPETVAELLAELGIDVPDDAPFACLLTGAHERECVLSLLPDLGTLGGAGVLGAPLPTDCSPAAWEPYFCAHATSAYQMNGVDIAFPCEIFDTSASFVDVAIEGALRPRTVPEGEVPVCQPGEYEMREGAWLDAVTAGCTNLNDAILTMCQQAAEFAPTTGACTSSGAW
jgi:hypothetical protein